MVSVLVVGYKAFDLGIFGDKDQRLKIIKAAIRRDLIYLLENGMKWLVFTGNLGFEVWVLEVAKVKIGMRLTKKNWLTLKMLILSNMLIQAMKIQVSFGLIINFC